MSINFHGQIARYFGFHGEIVNSENCVKRWSFLKLEDSISQDSHLNVWNAAAALNVFPIIGNILAGIFHIMMSIDGGNIIDKKLFARGVAEVTIVGGIILAFADIVVTVGRMCTTQPSCSDESMSEY